MNTESATNVLTRQWRIATYSKTVTPRNRMPETGASGSVGAPLEQSEGATRQQGPPYGRVEIWRGNKESRFQPPLIKPDVRISRIRLSDKGST